MNDATTEDRPLGWEHGGHYTCEYVTTGEDAGSWDGMHDDVCGKPAYVEHLHGEAFTFRFCRECAAVALRPSPTPTPTTTRLGWELTTSSRWAFGLVVAFAPIGLLVGIGPFVIGYGRPTDVG